MQTYRVVFREQKKLGAEVRTLGTVAQGIEPPSLPWS